MSNERDVREPANIEQENTEQEQSQELSMEELDKVAGGGGKQHTPPPHPQAFIEVKLESVYVSEVSYQ